MNQGSVSEMCIDSVSLWVISIDSLKIINPQSHSFANQAKLLMLYMSAKECKCLNTINQTKHNENHPVRFLVQHVIQSHIVYLCTAIGDVLMCIAAGSWWRSPHALCVVESVFMEGIREGSVLCSSTASNPTTVCHK